MADSVNWRKKMKLWPEILSLETNTVITGAVIKGRLGYANDKVHGYIWSVDLTLTLFIKSYAVL